MQGRIKQEHAARYILGGKARVVFFNSNTGNQRRYAITEWKGSTNKGVYSVWSSDFNLKALGTISHGGVFYPSKTATTEEAELAHAFGVMWTRIRTLTVPEYVHILHLGRCSVCGRTLTDAESIEKGIGPVCNGRQ
jgi:hypothetical protein